MKKEEKIVINDLFKKLENNVSLLEGELELEKAFDVYEESLEAIKKIEKQLSYYQNKIEVFEKVNNEFVLKEFNEKNNEEEN